MNMTSRVLPLGCLFTVLLSAAAHARPQPQQVLAVSTPMSFAGFDLSKDVAVGRPNGDERLQPLVEREEWRQSTMPQPRWAYKPAIRGPEVEFAVLGAGRKDMPSLAHVGVDWSF